MFKNYHRLLGHVLLACLTLQPFTVAAYSLQKPATKPASAPELVIPADFQASASLQSPWKRDLASLELLSQFPLHANKEFLELMRNKMPVSVEALEKQYTAQEIKEKRAWIKLFNNLQFVNEESKKTALTGLGRTITEAGRLSFLNIVAQENTDVGVAKNRQEFIRYLVQNPEKLIKIQEELHVIKKFEKEPLEHLFKKDLRDAYPPELRKQMKAQKVIFLGYLWLLATTLFYTLGKVMREECTNTNCGFGASLWKKSHDNQTPNTQDYSKIEEKLGVLGKLAPVVMNFRPNEAHTLLLEHVLLGLGYLFYTKYNEFEKFGNIFGGTAKYVASVLTTSLVALTALSPFSPKTAVSAAGSIAEIGIVHPLAFFASTVAKLAYFGWNRKQLNISFSTVHSEVHDQMSQMLKDGGDSFEEMLDEKIGKTAVPVKAAALPLMFIVSGFAYLMLRSLYENNKKSFKQANGIANIARSTQHLHDLLQHIPLVGVASGYTQSLESVSTLYRKIKGRAVSSSKYRPDAEYTPLNFFIHNTARDNYILQNTKETFEDFSKVSQFYGEIDAYASLAQLIIDHQTIIAEHGEEIRCCFVDFIDNTNESMVVAEDMWHPIIPTTYVQTNSIALGDSPENPRNGIITGPNAAGKSVSMKALLINLVLGQSFGIACAKSFKFTPFKKIIARLGSSDDTANDQSKFMLEASDVVALLKEIKAMKSGEKAFVVTDELFSGTEVNPAILLSLELCARISKFTNVCYLLATHYKDLTQLKEITGQQFENFKVSAFVVDKKVNYPFKLTKGIGDVNVAFDIFLDQMEKQGVKDEDLESIIENARNRQHLLEHTAAAIAV